MSSSTRPPEPAPGDAASDARVWRLRLALVAGYLLVAHLALIEVAGWPVAAVVLFFGAAWTLGAVWWKALVVAVVLAVVVQALFASGLGLSLPAGVLEGVPLLDG